VVVEGAVVELGVVVAEPEDVEVTDEVVVDVPSLEPVEVEVVDELNVVEVDMKVLVEKVVARSVEEELVELWGREVEGDVDELDDGVLSEINVAVLISEDL
jgi:hypothetical protein